MKKVFSELLLCNGRNTRAKFTVILSILLFTLMFVYIGEEILEETMIEIGKSNNSDAFNQIKTPLQLLNTIILPLTVLIVWVSIVNTIRRLHDINLSGWYFFIGYIPIINILFYIFVLFKKGNAESNQYGDNPLIGKKKSRSNHINSNLLFTRNAYYAFPAFGQKNRLTGPNR